MPRKERSIESRIKEHQKYRRQCEVRIASGKKLILITVTATLIMVWYKPSLWPIGVGIVAISAGSTLLEVWGYRKHDKAISKLSQNT